MAYNKSIRDKSTHGARQSKRKPPHGVAAPKGGFFAPSGLPKPLLWGGVELGRNDGGGKPVSKEHLHSDKHWLLIESSYRCVFVLSQHPCPLSLAPLASSPKGGALGRPGHFLLDARGPIWRKRAGLATEGSSFWISAPCQAAAALDSGALQPTKRINFARPAWA